MPIYDWNGSVHSEIGTIYDGNGSVNSQIKEVYDGNGSVNSLIYSAETPVTGWSFGGLQYWQGNLSISGSNLVFGVGKWGSNFGSLAWSSTPYSINTGNTIRYSMSQLNFQTAETGIAIGASHMGAIYVVFMTYQYNLESEIYNTPVHNLTQAGASVHMGPSCVREYRPANYGDVMYASAGPGTFTQAVPVSGSYYIGFCLSGWDGQQTSTTTISNVVIL